MTCCNVQGYCVNFILFLTSKCYIDEYFPVCLNSSSLISNIICAAEKKRTRTERMNLVPPVLIICVSMILAPWIPTEKPIKFPSIKRKMFKAAAKAQMKRNGPSWWSLKCFVSQLASNSGRMKIGTRAPQARSCGLKSCQRATKAKIGKMFQLAV